MSFGKPLAGKRKTRGKIDPLEESSVFLELYSEFYEQLSSMDEDDISSLVEKANSCQDGFGTALNSGDTDELTDLLSGL